MTIPIELILQIQSTGKELKREITTKNARQWQRHWCHRLLKYKRTSDEIKAAIAGGDVIVGWSNFDALVRAGATVPQLNEAVDFIFRKYE